MDTAPVPFPASPVPASPQDPRSVRGVLLSPGEFLWLTFAVWFGGVFILTVMPTLLIPRVGTALGVGGSYFFFFLAWQPVQSITQRALGVKVAAIRMLIFVTGAATLAFYLKGIVVGQ
jgi:hypothetical protein